MAKISKRRPAKGSAANLDTANHADDAAPHNAGMESAPRKKSDAADDDVHATAIKRWTAGHEREPPLGQGTALIVVEQDIGQALSVADRIFCLRRGAVALSGAPTEFTRDQIAAAYFGVAESMT